MKNRIFICLIPVLLLPGMVRAQENAVEEYRNALKLNSMALIFSNGSFQYERSLNRHWSLLAGGGFRWGGGVPKALGLGNLILTSETKRIKGYSFTPEARYYFNLCDCGTIPSGFYMSLYARFTRYYGDLAIHYWTGREYIDLLSASSFRELGVGFQLGYQLIIRKRFLVDFMFAGPRISTNRVRFDIESDYLAELVPAIEEAINERLAWLGYDPIRIDQPDDTSVEARFGFASFRYGIGIGLLF